MKPPKQRAFPRGHKLSLPPLLIHFAHLLTRAFALLQHPLSEYIYYVVSLALALCFGGWEQALLAIARRHTAQVRIMTCCQTRLALVWCKLPHARETLHCLVCDTSLPFRQKQLA